MMYRIHDLDGRSVSVMSSEKAARKIARRGGWRVTQVPGPGDEEAPFRTTGQGAKGVPGRRDLVCDLMEAGMAVELIAELMNQPIDTIRRMGRKARERA